MGATPQLNKLGPQHFLLLRPALQSSYDKIAGKNIPEAKIYLNCTVIWHLEWLAVCIQLNHGLHCFHDVEWDYEDVDAIIFCDASGVSLGFYIPKHCLGFTSSIPANTLIPNIFFYEALTIASAIPWAAKLSPPP
ncbi:hypothetical protein M422DRAFT_242477 [Sphaerobolus stellatus SS14]|nr:hypothetical protein M422DRAFT_242477 [Sphaerobolus stellatus SS14]